MAREFRGKIPSIPIDADTSQADEKIDKLFKRVKSLESVKIDADVNNAQRRLETLVKRTNGQMTSSLINNAIKDMKKVLGAMKDEFENNGVTSIYKNLEKTCDMVESRFERLNVTVGSKQLRGLEQILNNVTELESISKFDLGDIVSTQDVKNSDEVLKSVKETKKEITSIKQKAEYISKVLNGKDSGSLSEKRIQGYKDKLKDLKEELKAFHDVDNALIQNAVLDASAKLTDAIAQADAKHIKVIQAKTAAQEQANAAIEKQLQLTTKKDGSGKIIPQTNAAAEKSVSQQKIAEMQVKQNNNIASSYEGLAEAVEKYVTASQKLWHAYDYGEDFSEFAKQRNEAIAKIVSMFPDKMPDGATRGMSDYLMQSSQKLKLESQEWSRQYAEKGIESTIKSIETALTNANNEFEQVIKSSQLMTYDNASKWSDFAAYPSIRKQEDVEYLDQHADEVLKDLIQRSNVLSDNLKSVNEMVSRISKNASIKNIPFDDMKQNAADTAKTLSAMWEDGIKDTEEYITLQYKLNNLFEAIGKQYGGVRGSGAKDSVELRQWLINSITSETGYDIGSGYAIDALFERGKFSIFENSSQIKTMLELAAELQNYKGISFDDGFGAKYDKAELKRLQTTVQTLYTYLNNTAVQQMTKTAELVASLNTKYGSDRFTNIFGNVGEINKENASAVYDALIAKEQEYLAEIEKRQRAVVEFTTQVNGMEISADDPNLSGITNKVSTLSNEILEGKISSADATKALSEYIAGAVEQERQLQKAVETTTSAIEAQEAVVIKTKKSSASSGVDKEMSALTRDVDTKSLFSGVATQDMTEVKSEFYKIVDLIASYGRANKNGLDTTGIMNDIDRMTDNLVDMITDSVYSVTKKGEYIYQDFWEAMRGQHLQYDPDEYKKEFGDAFAEMIKGMTFGKHQKLFTKEQSPHAETADTLYERLIDDFGSIMLTRDGKKPNENNIYELFDAIVTTWRKAIDERSLGSVREPVLTSPKDEFQADLYMKIANATSQIASNVEKTISKEQELAAAAEKTAAAKKKQLEIQENASSNVSVEEIIARDIHAALDKLSSAKNNETTLFNLKNVSEGEDLINQAQEMVKNIAKQANLSLGLFNVKDNTIKVQLFNEELKITVDQMYKLRAASEDADSAALELVSQSFSQNVKALNKDTFDIDGLRDRAAASVEKVRSSLHGLEYDLTNLENAAKNISTEDDFKKFNNQLKATQDNIQAIKNATVSKSTMNQLANMQRDMKNANTELETMRLKLEKIGNIEGVKTASDLIGDMEQAIKSFNEASDAKGQQDAYSKYSDARNSFRVELEYLNQLKQKSSSTKTVDSTKENYKSILDIVTKINSVNKEILKYQDKDGGSGLFSSYINQLQYDKIDLVEKLKGITNDINDSLGGQFISGSNIELPFTKLLSNIRNGDAISDFFNDARTQAALTTEEIDKFIAALNNTRNIDVEAAAGVAEKFKSVQETYKQIMSLTNLDKNSINYQVVGTMFNDIMEYKNKLSDDPTQWSSNESMELQRLIDNFTKYGNILVEIGQKEEQYFSSKTKYSKGSTSMSGMAEDAKKASEIACTAQKKLTDAAQSFAKESGANGAIITNFAKGADGISRLDFSVLDQGTNTLRKFRMEMGSVSEGTFITETTVNNFVSKAQQASKQLSNVSDLIERLKLSEVNMDNGSIVRLLDIQKQLNAELAKGDGADQSVLTKLTKDAKLSAAEVEKLYSQFVKLSNLVDNGDASVIGQIDLNGDKYGQISDAIKEYAASSQMSVGSIGQLNEKTGQLKFTLTDASGSVHEFVANISTLGSAVIAQRTSVQEYASVWDRLKGSISRTGKQLATALIGANVFYKAISAIRKGYQYVKEIDSAMTELKKVTDETSISYKNFLNTASNVSSQIGTTVSDFTEATANFARLNI